jgi:hypothetical protein
MVLGGAVSDPHWLGEQQVLVMLFCCCCCCSSSPWCAATISFIDAIVCATSSAPQV